MKTAVVIITLANILMYSIALLVIYHKSRPKLRDKYNLREMYESDTGEKYETKKYLKWLSGFLLLVLSLGVSGQSGKIPLRQVADIDTTTIVKSSWQTYIERLISGNIVTYTAGAGVDLTSNEISLNFLTLPSHSGVLLSDAIPTYNLVDGTRRTQLGNLPFVRNAATINSTATLNDYIYWTKGSGSGLAIQISDFAALIGGGSGYAGWNVLTNGTFRKSIASGNNVNFAAGTGMAIAYSTSNNTLTFTSSGGSTTGQWADDVNGINYIGTGVKGRVGIGNSSVNIYTLNVDKSISGGWAANFQNSNTQGHGIRISTGNNNNSYAAIFAQSSLGSIFELTNAGRLRLTRYGSGTFNGIPTQLLGVDANGNVIETTGTGSYSLPLASSTTRGGIKVGFASTSNDFALNLSAEKGYVSLPDATVSLKGIASFNSSNFEVSSGLVGIKAKGINASLLNAGNTPLSGYVPTYNSTTGGFTWLPISSGGGDFPLGTDYQIPFMNSIGTGIIYDNNFVFENLSSTFYAPKISVYDNAYSSDWNGSLLVPTRNAVYDKIESLGSLTSPIRLPGTTSSVSNPGSYDGVLYQHSYYNLIYRNSSGRSKYITSYFESQRAPEGLVNNRDIDTRMICNMEYPGVSGSYNITLSSLWGSSGGRIIIEHSNTTAYNVTLYGNTDGSGNDFTAKTLTGGGVLNLSTGGTGYVSIIHWNYDGQTLSAEVKYYH